MPPPTARNVCHRGHRQRGQRWALKVRQRSVSLSLALTKSSSSAESRPSSPPTPPAGLLMRLPSLRHCFMAVHKALSGCVRACMRVQFSLQIECFGCFYIGNADCARVWHTRGTDIHYHVQMLAIRGPFNYGSTTLGWSGGSSRTRLYWQLAYTLCATWGRGGPGNTTRDCHGKAIGIYELVGSQELGSCDHELFKN